MDDEADSLDSLKIALDDTFHIVTATNAIDGYSMLKQHKDSIGVLMTDQRMPGESGTELLEKARALDSGIIRILVTAYSDISAAIDAVNMGAIYKYVSKPWDVRELEITLKQALDFFQLRRERDELLGDKLSVTYSMVLTDRIMMLGLIGVGLHERFRDAPAAVRSYLEFVGLGLRRDSISIERLNEISVWERFYKRAIVDAEALARVLGTLSSEPTGATDERDLVALALETAKEAGLPVEHEATGDTHLIPCESHTKQMFMFLWRTLAAISSTNCRLLIEDGAMTVACTIDSDASGGTRYLFNPFASRDPSHTSEIGSTLLAFFVIAYHCGFRVSGSGFKDGAFECRIVLPPAVKPPKDLQSTPLQSALINETLWERIMD